MSLPVITTRTLPRTRDLRSKTSDNGRLNLGSTHNPPTARVWLIGAFPPTGGGQGLVNESFRQMAEKAGATVRVIDLSVDGRAVHAVRREEEGEGLGYALPSAH